MRHPDGTLDIYARTDTVSAELDEQQYQLQEGPCYDTTTHTLYAVAGDLGADNRYPSTGRSPCGRVSDPRRLARRQKRSVRS